MPITHAKTSTVEDGVDTDLVQPSDWNADHVGNGLGWFNVKDYGATGDGTTDDTSAISDAITALTAAGRGVLYFPTGTYVTSGGFSISVPCLILGDGSAVWASGAILAPISLITCTSATASLFTVTADFGRFENLALQNTSVSTPTAGAGITVIGDSLNPDVSFLNVSVMKFYINIDSQANTHWTMNDCTLIAPVLYALKIKNTFNADSGDWSLDGCQFWAAANRDADAAIRIEGSGGGKIVNCKINEASPGGEFNHGIDMAVGASVQTAILLFSNNSIENLRGNGINITSSASKPSAWDSIIINGNQIALHNLTTGHAIAISADALGDIDRVIISDNIFRANPGSTVSAIDLINVDTVLVANNINYDFDSLLTQTNCTNVIIEGSHAAVTVSDSTTVDLTLTGQEISAAVIPSGIKLDDLGTPDDNTDLNSNTTRHGLLKKLSNVSTEFLNGIGNWATPIGAGEILVADNTTPLEMLTNEAEDDYLFGG